MADQVAFSEEQQDYLNKLVGRTRIEAREAARAEYEQELAKQKEKADREALVANQEWKELADKSQARVSELEPLEGKMTKYRETIEGMLADKVKALGDEAKKAIDALPGDLDPLEKLQWLVANETLFTSKTRELGTRPATRETSQGRQQEGSGCNIRF